MFYRHDQVDIIKGQVKLESLKKLNCLKLVKSPTLNFGVAIAKECFILIETPTFNLI